MWLAGALLLAHSFVPHEHGKEHEVVHSDYEASGIVDLLSGLFHNDLGEEHLEHFEVQKSKALEFHVETTAIEGNCLLLIALNEPAQCISFIENSSAAPHRVVVDLRGPPVV